MREKLIELLMDMPLCRLTYEEMERYAENVADYLIANGVVISNLETPTKWIPASEPPKENGYYLCVILFSSVGSKKKYTRKILFWEDNVWIDKPNSFRIEKPLYWMPMADMPQPPKGE